MKFVINRVINKMNKTSKFYAKIPTRIGDIKLFSFARWGIFERSPGITINLYKQLPIKQIISNNLKN